MKLTELKLTWMNWVSVICAAGMFVLAIINAAQGRWVIVGIDIFCSLINVYALVINIRARKRLKALIETRDKLFQEVEERLETIRANKKPRKVKQK